MSIRLEAIDRAQCEAELVRSMLEAPEIVAQCALLEQMPERLKARGGPRSNPQVIVGTYTKKVHLILHVWCHPKARRRARTTAEDLAEEIGLEDLEVKVENDTWNSSAFGAPDPAAIAEATA